MVVERLKRKATLGWVPLEKMRVREEIAQRKFRQHWANTIAQEFDLEKFGTPTVNRGGEWYWILDGQHRVAALKMWLKEWSGQKIECWIYHKLSEKEEADTFLSLNRVRLVNAFDKFKIALTARHEEETNIEAIVRKNKLKISQQQGDGAVACVGTLLKVYGRGPDCLDRDLKIVSQAFGDSGLDALMIGGIGMMIGRYDGKLDDASMIRALSGVRGGANTVRTRAEQLRQQTGTQKAQCIAAAAVEVYNRATTAKSKKLPNWWKTEDAG